MPATRTRKTAKRNGRPIAPTLPEGRMADMMDEAPDEGAVIIPQLDIQVVQVKVVGATPLIIHCFSEKAQKAMRDKQAGTAEAGRKKRKPKEEYEAAFHRLPDKKPGIPAVAFKAAMVTGCTSLKGVMTKIGARQAFHVIGDPGPDLVEIHGKPRMRTDMVRIGMGIADLRYRPEFPQWWVNLVIQYNARVITPAQLVNLLNVAGFAVGVGEMRPERGPHSNGRFEVQSS